MSQHSHGEKRLHVVLLLTSTFLVAEVVGGILANSLALLSDAGHMLTDVSALLLAIFAARHGRRPPDRKRTYGYRRLEVLAALANGLLLVLVAGIVLREAWLRLGEPHEVHEELMLYVASAGLLVNLAGLWLLHRDHSTNINIRGVFLHVLGDALGSIGVIVGAIVIMVTGWTQADAVASIAISLLILVSAIRLIRESLHYLLEGTPREISIAEVKQLMCACPGVLGVHDLHLWRISSGMDILTVHIVLEDPSSWREIRAPLRDELRARFGVTHATIQVEGPDEIEGPDHTEGICDSC